MATVNQCTTHNLPFLFQSVPSLSQVGYDSNSDSESDSEAESEALDSSDESD